MPGDTNTSGIRDNYLHGSAGDFVISSIVPEAKLSFVSAYFTIHAFDALRSERGYLNLHAEGKTQLILELVQVWAAEISDESLKKAANAIIFGLR